MSLAESIASWEQETPRDELTRGQRKRVYVSLYQTHIPKLESVDIVVQEENAVRPTSKIYELDSYLTTENSTSPWYYVTGIASAIALVFLALIALEPAVGSTSAYLVTTVLLAAMAIVATGQFVGRRRENRALPPELLLGPGSAGETP